MQVIDYTLNLRVRWSAKLFEYIQIAVLNVTRDKNFADTSLSLTLLRLTQLNFARARAREFMIYILFPAMVQIHALHINLSFLSRPFPKTSVLNKRSGLNIKVTAYAAFMVLLSASVMCVKFVSFLVFKII